MVYCKAVGCSSDSNNKNLKVTWHSFPRDQNLRRQWMNRINRQNYEEKYWRPTHKICGLHFRDPEDFRFPSPKQAVLLEYKPGRHELASGVVPTLNLGKTKDVSKKPRMAAVKRQNLQVCVLGFLLLSKGQY